MARNPFFWPAIGAGAAQGLERGTAHLPSLMIHKQALEDRRRMMEQYMRLREALAVSRSGGGAYTEDLMGGAGTYPPMTPEEEYQGPSGVPPIPTQPMPTAEDMEPSQAAAPPPGNPAMAAAPAQANPASSGAPTGEGMTAEVESDAMTPTGMGQPPAPTQMATAGPTAGMGTQPSVPMPPPKPTEQPAQPQGRGDFMSDLGNRMKEATRRRQEGKAMLDQTHSIAREFVRGRQQLVTLGQQFHDHANQALDAQDMGNDQVAMRHMQNMRKVGAQFKALSGRMNEWAGQLTAVGLNPAHLQEEHLNLFHMQTPPSAMRPLELPPSQSGQQAIRTPTPLERIRGGAPPVLRRTLAPGQQVPPYSSPYQIPAKPEAVDLPEYQQLFQ